MIRFEIDPTLAADAIRQGRKLNVEIFQTQGGWFKKVTLGLPSPHRPDRHAAAMALSKAEAR